MPEIGKLARDGFNGETRGYGDIMPLRRIECTFANAYTARGPKLNQSYGRHKSAIAE